MGFKVDDKKLKRAGLDYWHFLDITYYKSLDDFFERTKGGKYYYFSTKAPQKHTDISYPDGCYILFGKETAVKKQRACLNGFCMIIQKQQFVFR